MIERSKLNAPALLISCALFPGISYGDFIGLDANETTVNNQNNVNLVLHGNANNDRLYGIYSISNNPLSASNVTLDGTTDITLNLNAIAVTAYGVFSGGDSLTKTKDIVITMNSDPNVYNTNAYGIYATKETASMNQAGKIVIDGNLVINSSGSIKPQYIVSTSGAEIELNGSVTLGATSNVNDVKNALYAYGQNSRITSQNQKMHIVGNITATAATIDLVANNHSYFKGASSLGANGVYNLSLKDNSSWDMTGTSAVSNLTLDSTSQVNFTAFNNGNNYSILNVTNLAGSGKFKMNVDLANQQNDLLNIMGSTAGSHQLLISDDGSVVVDGTETITLVNTANGGGSFSSRVGLGGYSYELRQNGNNWELYSTGRAAPSASASASLMNINYLMNYVDNQTLFQRMGNIRNSEQYDGDVWMRGVAGKVNMGSNGKLSGFDMKYGGGYLGIDKLLNSASGRLYIGSMIGYIYTDNDYESGSGNAKNYNAGLYGTYITDSGFYIDTILKYNHVKNKYAVLDNANNTISGSANSDGYGASIEIGQRLSMQNTAFYFEPQAQVSWMHQGSAESHDSSGLTVKLDSYNSTLGRISGIIGYDNQYLDTYLKVGYVRELAGNSSYHLNSNTEKFEHNSGWLGLGLGFSTRLAQSHNLYGEVSYADGSRFDQKQINLGYRYQF